MTSACFAVAGVLFVLYPAIRPFSDETSLHGAAAFGSTAWVVAHSFAIVAFILLVLGIFGLYLLLQDTSVEKVVLIALVASWIGVGLTLPFYGAEVFGLHAIGQAALKQNSAALVSLAADVRGAPGIWFIIFGLILLGAGTIVLAVGIWRSGVLVRWGGIPLAAGFALYIPQFTASQQIRVAHGFLVTLGCGLLAWNVLAACGKQSSVASSINVTSPAFGSNAAIPTRYTCSGADVSPPIRWTGAPSGTQTLALTVIDPDAPGKPFVHWVIFNLPATSTELPEGAAPSEGSVQGRNDFGSNGYRGPCPPPGAPHHYHFTVYALDAKLSLRSGASESDFETAIKNHTLATGELVGTFKR